ncbi:hypothetical protein KAI87_04885 [Myxococcota bacterium]|nr:hypothetical protein [Myxococcota bacterium]
MRKAIAFLFVALPVILGGCAINDTTIEGPSPDMQTVERADTGFPTEAVFCTELAGTLHITGEGLEPMPIDTLTDNPSLKMPQVALVAADGTEVVLPDVVWDPTAKDLTIAVPTGIAPGSYILRVTHPNGNVGELADGVVIAPVPTITGIDPVTGLTNEITPVTITGTDYREAGDGTLPTADLAVDGGTAYGLDGVALVSATSLTGNVISGLPVGVYDLTVTNPEGCSATLVDAFTVTEPPSIDICEFVNPAFGWIDDQTTIEICANNAGENLGLLAVPEVFLMIDANDDGVVEVELPLIREAYLSEHTKITKPDGSVFDDASLMSAVVPSSTDSRSTGIAVGGPYDIKVVNPDGSIGLIPDAYTVLPEPAPRIDAVAPEQAETGANSGSLPITITGADFKSPDNTADPRLARVVLLGADQDVGELCDTADGRICYECTDPVGVDTAVNGVFDTITCNVDTGAMPVGVYLVRYEHLDDGSFSEYSAFVLTNPAGNLSGVSTTLDDALNTLRFAHDSVFAKDDLRNRFIWVAGGQSGAAADTALDSIEVASVLRYGQLGAWTDSTLLRSSLPKKLSGLNLETFGGYIFALGGRDEAGDLNDKVYRAKILDSKTAPVIKAPSALATGTLEAGSYSYRVSAIMGAATDNPDGETLPSDAESIRLGDGESGVKIEWDAVTDAVSYRIYRTVAVNDFAGTDVLLATGVTATSFDDDGSATPAGDAPLPPGSLGQWAELKTLGIARADAGSTIASDGTDDFLYILGGRILNGTEEANDSYEYAKLITDGTTGVVSLGDFTKIDTHLLSVVAEHVVVTLNKAGAPRLLSATDEFVVLGQGTDDTSLFSQYSMAKVLADGVLDAFAEVDSSASATRKGTAGVLVNNYLFSIGGIRGTAVEDQGLNLVVCNGVDVCPAGDPALDYAGGNLGVTLNEPRYRATLIYVGGLFYSIGGTNDTGSLATVEYTVYAGN